MVHILWYEGDVLWLDHCHDPRLPPVHRLGTTRKAERRCRDLQFLKFVHKERGLMSDQISFLHICAQKTG